MNNTAQNILLVTLSTMLIAAVTGILYVSLHTPDLPKFFPTELSKVRKDFNLVIVEPEGAPNPYYQHSYANSK